MAPRNGVKIITPGPKSRSLSLSSHGSQPTGSILKNSLRNVDPNANVNFVGADGKKYCHNSGSVNNSSRSVSQIDFSDDDSAVRRAHDAFSSATVLKKTGFAKRGDNKNAPAKADPNTSRNDTSNRSRSGSVASNEKHTGKTTEGKSRGMNFPRTIPITRDDESQDNSCNTSVSSKRSRSATSGYDALQALLGERATAAAGPLVRRKLEHDRTEPCTWQHQKQQQSDVSSHQQRRDEQSVTQVNFGASKTAGCGSVCGTMFSGLSAIPMSDKLFDSLEEENSVARACYRPLWSLVGTYKIALHNVVEIDYNADVLRWNQQNPRGGYQRISVPLTGVTDVMCTRISQSDAGIKEYLYTAVVKTRVRPSQVVFGFRTQTEAKKFCAAVTK